MGSRPTKVSSSILGMQTLALREDPTLVNSENVPLKSPIMSIVPRATRHAAVHENGFVTARSRGRSVIYNMARTPYARIYPTSTLKVAFFLNDILDHSVSRIKFLIWFVFYRVGGVLLKVSHHLQVSLH